MFDMDVREGRYDAYPHCSDGVGVSGLPSLSHGRNVVTGPVAGERRHRSVGIVMVLCIDVLPDGCLAALTQFHFCWREAIHFFLSCDALSAHFQVTLLMGINMYSLI